MGSSGIPIGVPCRRCIGCRLDLAGEWATRIVNEASLHEDNAFLTLTYASEFLPDDYSVNVRDIQLFTKRLRKSIEPGKMRFYACGEYGDKDQRPHYHMIAFGYWPDDAQQFFRTKRGDIVYISEKLTEIWGQGHVSVGRVTTQSAGYVARYAVKKMGGDRAIDHYTRVHPETGQVVVVRPEFSVMSTKPGIGSRWFEQFEGECYPSDFVVIDGRKRPVPRYYRNKLRARYERDWSDASSSLINKDDLYRARLAAREHASTPEAKANSTRDRLDTREESLQLKAKRLHRDI